MKVLIDIPEELYKAVMACKDIPPTNEGTIDNVLTLAVEHGIPLPKGHGRIGDLDALFDEVGMIKPRSKTQYNDIGMFMNMITNTTTIIKADKGE